MSTKIWCKEGCCKSLEKILCSEAELTEYLIITFFSDVMKWIESIEDTEKRISLYREIMVAYTNRTCIMSKLISSSKGLTEKYRQKKKKCFKKVSRNIFILGKVKIINRYSCKKRVCFLVYNCCTNKVKLCRYNKKYDDDCLNMNVYFLK